MDDRMTQVEVKARFDDLGEAQPLQIVMDGNTYLIKALGRRWADAAGRHILVMIRSGTVIELVFDPQNGCWYLNKTARDKKRVLSSGS